MLGQPERNKDLITKAQDPISGLISGLTTPIKADVLAPKVGPGWAQDMMGGAFNMFYDPLFIAGGLSAPVEGLKGASAALAGAEEAAPKVSAIGNILGKAFSAGREAGVPRMSLENALGLGLRTGRRIYQGNLLSENNDIVPALTYAGIAGPVEGVGSKALGRISPEARSAVLDRIGKFFTGESGNAAEAAGEAVGKAVAPAVNPGQTGVADSVADLLMQQAPATPMSDADFTSRILGGDDTHFVDQLESFLKSNAPTAPRAAGVAPDPQALLDVRRMVGEVPTLQGLMGDPRFANIYGAARRSAAMKLLAALEQAG